MQGLSKNFFSFFNNFDKPIYNYTSKKRKSLGFAKKREENLSISFSLNVFGLNYHCKLLQYRNGVIHYNCSSVGMWQMFVDDDVDIAIFSIADCIEFPCASKSVDMEC